MPITQKNHSTLNTRLCDFMKTNQFTIHTLSQKSGIAVGTIQRIMTDPVCNPTLFSLEAICKALKISLFELIGEFSDEKKKYKDIPFFAPEELSIFLEKPWNSKNISFKKKKTIKVSSSIGKNAFATRMVNDIEILPLFTKDSLLIFDPNKVPRNGHYVLVNIAIKNKIYFKQFIETDDRQYIKSIIPISEECLMALDSNDKIIAVLIASQIQY